jgi:erythromycin esterase-like protein
MQKMGQINLGGIAREKYGREAVALVGFSTYQGTVVASHAWDGPIEVLTVPPAKDESYEWYFHQAMSQIKSKQAYLVFDQDSRKGQFASTHGHRAIGVVYDPNHERWGNYVPTSLANRYDAFLFIDETRAIEPLIQSYKHDEFPETWPAGQ